MLNLPNLFEDFYINTTVLITVNPFNMLLILLLFQCLRTMILISLSTTISFSVVIMLKPASSMTGCGC